MDQSHRHSHHYHCERDLCRRVLAVPVLIFTLSILLSLSHLSSTHAYVTEENNFVILKTRESGTFVGVKEGQAKGLGSTASTTGSSSNSRNNESVSAGFSLPNVYYAFRGIPYAKPPVGQLRWKEPEPPDITAGPKDATKLKSICSQWDDTKNEVIGSPDCLYLNIFTPRLHFNIARLPTDKESSPYDEDPRHSVRLLPTLVYIHNGDFTSGSGHVEHYERFLDENTLLVTFNYRLGIFGFLSSGKSTSLSGNYGILDQILAMKWIKKNIHRFGGDPSRVTIFGAVSSLLLSPLASSSDLYQGIILMESPTSIFTPRLITEDPHAFYSAFLKGIDCSIEGSEEEILDCLILKSGEDLIAAQHDLGQTGNFFIGPIVDSFPLRENMSAVFPVHPEDIIQSAEFRERNISILFGVNMAEGFPAFQQFHNHFLQNSIFEEMEVKRRLSTSLSQILPKLSLSAIDDVWEFYFANFTNWSTEKESLFNYKLMQLFGDVSVYNGNWKLLETLAEKPTYIFNYVFEHNVEETVSYLKQEKSGLGVNGYFPWEEEFHLFSQGVETTDTDHTSQSDKLMSNILVKIWTSFTAYSTPKNALAKQKTWGKWLRFNVKDNSTNYYHLKANQSQMNHDYRRKEAEFWKNTMSKVYTEDKSRTLEEVERSGVLKTPDVVKTGDVDRTEDVVKTGDVDRTEDVVKTDDVVKTPSPSTGRRNAFSVFNCIAAIVLIYKRYE